MGTLGSDGYTSLTEAQWLQIVRDRTEANLQASGNPSDISWASDTFFGLQSAVDASSLGQSDQAQQASYDGTQFRNATGIQLADQGESVGLTQEMASFGTITLSLTGTAGTLILAGSLASGVSNPSVTWALNADVTLPAVGAVAFTATTAGNLPESDAEIWTIVSAVPGWDTATSSTDAIAGSDDETEAAFRLRISARRKSSKNASTGAIASRLNALVDVTASQVIENDRHFIQNVGGKFLPPNSINVIIHPNINAKPEAIKEVAEIIYTNIIGIRAFGTDVVTTVTGIDGRQKEVAFDYATEVGVDVVVVVTAFVPGASQTSIIADITTGISAYFAALLPGDDVSMLAIQCIIQGTGGVLSATLTLNTFPLNVLIEPTQVASLLSLSVS